MPGDAVNDLNNAYTGIAGAENAVLANAQTGANLLDAANPFLATGTSVKYPPVGTTAQSVQQSYAYTPQQQQQQKPASSNPSSTSPGGNTPSTGQQTGAAASPSNSGNNLPITGAAGVDGTDTGIGGLSSAPTDAFGSTDTSGTQYGDAPTDAFGGADQFTGGATPNFENPSGALPTSPQGTSGGIDMPLGGENPSEGTSDLGSSGGINQPGPVDTSGDTPYTDPTSGGGPNDNYTPPPDSGGSPPEPDYENPSGGGYYGSAAGGAIPYPQQSYAGGGFSNTQQQSAIPPQGQGGGATTGGKVPLSASPSQGQQTDDVSARLNAGEFVVPKDVAAWKGQEFFQKLIEQSRKARMGSPAKPKLKAPLPNQRQPSFISRHMPAQRPIQRPGQ
jgi:hypothetical protein